MVINLQNGKRNMQLLETIFDGNQVALFLFLFTPVLELCAQITCRANGVVTRPYVRRRPTITNVDPSAQK